MAEEPSSTGSARGDQAFVFANFDAPNRDAAIAANETSRYAAEYPDRGAATIEAEIEQEKLAALRDELQRANEEKKRATYLTDKQVSKRRTPLTVHDKINYLLIFILSFAGVFVATYALAVYASDSGVVTALNSNIVAAILISFPVLAVGQGVKAAGALQKDDVAKAAYFNWLVKLGAVAFVLFVAGAVVSFAPHPTDLASVQAQLEPGSSPPPSVFFDTCRAISPYLAVGGGLLAEIMWAAVLGHRADAINAIGRDVSQQVGITQHVLDQRIAVLHRRIEPCAQKAGRLQAVADRHRAALAARIEAAQAYARELEAQYAASKAALRREFLSQQTGKED